jgi:hypothetical protein
MSINSKEFLEGERRVVVFQNVTEMLTAGLEPARSYEQKLLRLS